MADDRIEEIKHLLFQERKLYVNELSERYNVSKVSVRKYLARLESEGIAVRFYGGASLAESAVPGASDEDFYSDPLLLPLAREARRQISDGDSIFIGSGRSCCILARLLSGLRNLTVVTNNITAMPDVIRHAARVYMLGGEVTSTDSLTQFASWESPENLLGNIFVNKAFTSTSGLDLKAGLTVDSIISTYIFKHIPAIAHKWYLLADSTKFGKISIYSVADLGRINAIISDEIPAEYAEAFKEKNIEIIELGNSL